MAKKLSLRNKYKSDKKTKLTEFETFMDDYNKEIYESVTAEFKRIIYKKVTEVLPLKRDVIYKTIIDSIFGEGKYNDDFRFPVGHKIPAPVNTYIIENKVSEIIEYMFKKNDQWHSYRFELSDKNTGTRVSLSHELKLGRTITGFNGRLGSIKFKRESKKELNGSLQALKNKLGIKEEK